MFTKKLPKLNPYPFLLAAIAVLICIASYSKGTFLTGWDTLHPELNFGLNFKRLIFGFWREEQGLGAVAGHSHMVDLPRVIILWILSLTFPLNMLRYMYVFFCLVAGPLGMYFLTSFLFRKKTIHFKLIAFLSGLFYLCNPSTIQQFYVPFEMFPAQYAALPWIVWSALAYLTKPERKTLFIFSIVTLLATPQAYAAHLWYPFFGIFSLFVVLVWFFNKQKIKLASAACLIVITLALNSFWLLPNLYYISTSSEAPRINKNNRLHSQEFRLKNRETGTLKDIPLNRGFYFNWEIFNFDEWQSQSLMPEWNSHFKKLDISVFGYSLFVFALVGMITGIKKKKKIVFIFLPFFWIPFIFLANRLVIFGNFFDALIKISFLEEALRFVYTKFSILYQFGMVVFFGYFLHFLFNKLKIISKIQKITAVLTVLFLIYIYPAFSGNLISPKVKINIPDYYFQFWDHMKNQPDGLVLTLPLHQSSGWQYYDWKYQGSGFIWFGLKQPVLDRDFDRWETKNEQAYREFYHSLYLNDPETFKKDLEKYNVKYIVWDKSSTSTALKNTDQIIYRYETKKILDSLESQGYIKLNSNFGKISLYQTNLSLPLVFGLDNSPIISPDYLWGYSDTGYQLHGNYISSFNKKDAIVFPFRDLLTKHDKIDQEKIAITNNGVNWNLKPNLILDVKITPPSVVDVEKEIFTQASIKNNLKNEFEIYFNYSLPDSIKNLSNNSIPIKIDPKQEIINLNINQNIFEISVDGLSEDIPKPLGPIYLYSTQNNINGEVFKVFPENINLDNIENLFFSDTPVMHYNAQQIYSLNKDSPGIELLESPDNTPLLNYTALNNTYGTSINLEKIPHALGYIIGFKSLNISGIPLRFCLKNLYTSLCSIEDELSKNSEFEWDYFLVPPTDQAYGYNILLNAISYADLKTQNQLEEVVVIPIPYNLLSQSRYNSQPINTLIDNNWKIKTNLPGAISIEKNENKQLPSIIVFNQSYNKDWIAFYLQNNKPVLLKNHLLVNNWANGWNIEEHKENLSGKTIYFVFWPQILEFIGFALIPFVFLFALKKKN